MSTTASAALCHPIWFVLRGTIMCFSTGQRLKTHLQALWSYLTKKESDGELHQTTWPHQT